VAKKVSLILSHWYHLIEGFQVSPSEFYEAVEEAVLKRNIPNLKLSRVTYREGGPLSPKREYLRVERKEYLFDICCAPFGAGFFVSWWLGEAPGWLEGIIASIPIINHLFFRFFRPLTYYQLDTALMFQESVHAAVLEVIDQMMEAKGLRLLSETERKPILREIFQK